VTSAQLLAGEEGCAEGGSKFTVGRHTTTACNGEKGEPGEPGKAGFTKTLPNGETETGSFVTQLTETTEGARFVPISFPIPLPLPIDSGAVHYVTLEEQKKENGEAPPAECQGTAVAPTAAKGSLCVYEGFASEPEGAQILNIPFILKSAPEQGGAFERGASTAGALLGVSYEGPSGTISLYGTWAVSAL
jgi:hypothetical protein